MARTPSPELDFSRLPIKPQVTRASTISPVDPAKPRVVAPNENEIIPANLHTPAAAFERPTISALLRRGEMPRIIPAFLGLQARLLPRRIERIEATLAELGVQPPVRRERKAQHWARSAIHSKGYWGDDDELRPTSLVETVIAKAITALDQSRSVHVGWAHNNARLFNAHENEGFVPDFSGPGENATLRETLDNSRKARRYDRDLNRVDRRNRLTRALVSPRRARIERLIRQRDRLLLLEHGIDNVRNGRPANWREGIGALETHDFEQFGQPDERGRVTVGKVYNHDGRAVALNESAETSGPNREILISATDGTRIYIQGNTAYSWQIDETDDGTRPYLRNEEQELRDGVLGPTQIVMRFTGRNTPPEPRGRLSYYRPQSVAGPDWLQPIVVGRPWAIGEQPTTQTAVNAVIVRGIMNAQTARDMNLERHPLNVFEDARRIAQEIDRRESEVREREAPNRT